MLNFCHSELADSQKTLARGNFIPEPHANLSCCKGHPAVVVLNQAAEVNEDTLSCFRSQVALILARRSNLRIKHQVERN